MTKIKHLSRYLLLIIVCLCLYLPVQAQGTDRRVDPKEVKANLKNILNDKEFQSVQTADPTILEKTVRWIREMWDRLMEWFSKLFRFHGIGAGSSPALQWVFIAVFIVIGTYVAFLLIRSYLANRVVKQAKARTAFDLDDTEEDISREPNDWLQEAGRREAEGDFRRAYRAVFLAILLQFDAAGILAFERSRANGEYLRFLRRAGRGELYDLLSPLVLEFDLRWYGTKETQAEDVPAIRKDYDRLRDLLVNESKNNEETGTNSVSLTPEQT